MKILNYALILLFTLGMLSCGSSGGGSDETAPIIDFSSPSTNPSSPTVIAPEDIVNFIGTVSDNKELKSITFTDLIERTKSVSDFMKDFNVKLNSKTPSSGAVLDKEEYNVNFSIKTLAGAPAQEYTLTCTVVDNSENTITKTFYIKVE